ncbi:MAG: ABC transporter substrate-binding protein [Ilumatobacteraceae bacterium]
MSRTAIRRTAVFLLGAALFAAACGSDDAPASSADAATTTTQAAATTTQAAGTGAFPMTLDTPHGSTTLTAAPQRVVALTTVDFDIALSYGVVPVAAVASVADPNAADEHLRARLAELEAVTGQSVEVWLDAYFTDDVNVELLATTRPDLILATSDWSLGDHYESLASLAPVAGYTVQNGPEVQPWTEKARIIAQAFGTPDLADDVIAEVDEMFAQAREEHPQFAGVSLTYAVVFPPAEDVSFLSATGAVDDDFFEALGFAPSPNADQFGPSYPDNLLSLERLDLLDADLLVLGMHEGLSEAERNTIIAMPLFQAIPAVADGRSVVLPEGHSSNIVYPAPLLLRAELDVILPVLEEVLPAA